METDNTNQQIPPQAPLPNPSSHSKILIIVLAIIGFLAIGIGGYVLGIKGKQIPLQSQPTIPSPNTQLSPTPGRLQTETYINSEHKFSVMYPPGWIINSKNKEITLLASQDGKEYLEGSKNAKFPEYYIRISLITQKDISDPLEKELQSTYTESPQCMVGGECPEVAPTITQKTNQNSVKYYLITTGVYDNQVAVFPFPNDPTKYIELNTRVSLISNRKIPDQILTSFQFLDQQQTGLTQNIVKLITTADYSRAGGVFRKNS